MDLTGNALWFIGLTSIAAIFTAIGYVFKKGIVALLGAPFWIFAGIWAYNLSARDWESWDVYLGMAFVCLIFTLVSVFAPAAAREKYEDVEQTVEKKSEAQQFQDEFAEMGRSLHVIGGGGQPAPQQLREEATEQAEVAGLEKFIKNRRAKTLRQYKEGV